MSNLTNNTEKLQSLLTKINELPSAEGIDTSDATATNSDLPNGIIAYAKGQRLEGNIYTIDSNTVASLPATSVFKSLADENIIIGQCLIDKDRLYRKDSFFNVQMNASDLGEATTADVAAGVTFTSKNGVNITGTASIGAAPVTEDVNVTTTASGFVTFTTSKTISKVCSISLFIEDKNYNQSYKYVYRLVANGTFTKYSMYQLSVGWRIIVDSSSIVSGESISGNTVTYGTDEDPWKTDIPKNSEVFATITYIPA